MKRMTMNIGLVLGSPSRETATWIHKLSVHMWKVDTFSFNVRILKVDTLAFSPSQSHLTAHFLAPDSAIRFRHSRFQS